MDGSLHDTGKPSGSTHEITTSLRPAQQPESQKNSRVKLWSSIAGNQRVEQSTHGRGTTLRRQAKTQQGISTGCVNNRDALLGNLWQLNNRRQNARRGDGMTHRAISTIMWLPIRAILP